MRFFFFNKTHANKHFVLNFISAIREWRWQFQAWPPSPPPLPGSVFLFLYFEDPVKNETKKSCVKRVDHPWIFRSIYIYIFFFNKHSKHSSCYYNSYNVSLWPDIFFILYQKVKNISTAKKKRERETRGSPASQIVCRKAEKRRSTKLDLCARAVCSWLIIRRHIDPDWSADWRRANQWSG